MRLILVLALGTCFISCKKPTVSTTNFYVSLNATMNGAKEVPANASAATGTATATYNRNTRILKVYVTWSGVTATQGHIHKGAVGVPGPVVFPFTSLVSPLNYESPALDAAQEADLLANLFYVNIHSAVFPNGEIRGQLIVQ